MPRPVDQVVGGVEPAELGVAVGARDVAHAGGAHVGAAGLEVGRRVIRPIGRR